MTIIKPCSRINLDRLQKKNAQIAKDLKITPILDKLLGYKRSWTQHVNRMPRNRLPRVIQYCPQLAEGIMVDL